MPTCQEWLLWDDPVQVKFEVKEVDPSAKGCKYHVAQAERCPVGVSRPSCMHSGISKYYRTSHGFSAIAELRVSML